MLAAELRVPSTLYTGMGFHKGITSETQPKMLSKQIKYLSVNLLRLSL